MISKIAFIKLKENDATVVAAMDAANA